MNNTNFLDNSKNKTNEKTAFYQGKFSEYEIFLSKNVHGFYVLTDTIKDRDSSDLVDGNISTFVFSDCKKSFDEIMLNLNKNLKSNIKFGSQINLVEQNVENIKIRICGFDEITDSFSFDFNKFPSDSTYKYRISKDEFYAYMLINLDAKSAKELVDSFLFRGRLGFYDKRISIFVNDIYLYEINLKDSYNKILKNNTKDKK